MTKWKHHLGFSLVEILVAISVFSVLGLLISRILIQTLRTTSKTDATTVVKENLGYAVSVMERQIRNSSVGPTCCNTPPCTVLNALPSGTAISFANSDEENSYFSLAGSAISWKNGEISEVNLTASEIFISSLTFICTQASGATLANVEISATASKNGASVEGAQVTSTSRVYLRNY